MASWGSQFSSGDQSRDARSEFANSSYSICPKCKGKDFRNEKTVAGCRHNGDGYGTEEYTCRGCGWATSFQYDEAGDSYFYETRYFNSTPAPPKVDIVKHLLANLVVVLAGFLCRLPDLLCNAFSNWHFLFTHFLCRSITICLSQTLSSHIIGLWKSWECRASMFKKI